MPLPDLDFLTPEGQAAILAALPSMTAAEKEALLADLDELERIKGLERCRDDFLAFCHRVYVDFKEGPHHRHIRPLLHEVLVGEKTRLTISLAPRFGKSIFVSYLFAAWYLGHNPTHHIMMVTHTAELSAEFGRQVRNLIASQVYRDIFPNTVVSADKSAASNWSTTVGGKYLAIGIGANVAGHGAHLLIADDLVSERAVMTGNGEALFEEAWKYMQVGPLQRLMPYGKIVQIGCMTAETRVLMADGTEKELQHIQVGDTVATYDAGKITTSCVTNWIEHRPDFVYKIKTSSGRIVRANKRHPFLVDRDGARAWVRVRDLKVGDCLVKVVPPQGVCDRTKPEGCAAFATNEYCEPKGAQAPSDTRRIGGSGRALSAQSKGVANPFPQKGCVAVATEKRTGETGSVDSQSRKNAVVTSSTDTVFLLKLTRLWSNVKEVVAQYVSSHRIAKTHEPDKCRSCTSTTVTTQIASEGCCAIIAIWPLATQAQKTYYSKRLDTFDTTPDAIVEIVEDGFEPVFDMEVERTENFIANGVVSHNTRWGKKDPIGRSLQWAEQNKESTPWYEVRFPAIMPSGKSLWPEQWPLDQLLAKKAGMFPQFWSAQYMQEPTSEEGAVVKREWWRVWEKEKPPKCHTILQSWDTAHETKSKSDPSGVVTLGIFQNEHENDQEQIILLDAWQGRKEFPDLKKFALEYYKEWEPDMVIIEKKAAGAPLIQEMRAIGIPVQEFSPSRGNDKLVRINACADMFASGMVWAPEHRWAREVIDQIAEFPNSDHDEFVDTVSQAMMRIRQGGFVRLDSDEKYDENDADYRQPVNYY